MPSLHFNLDRLHFNIRTFVARAHSVFPEKKVQVFYALKAHNHPQINQIIFNNGLGAEVLSLRELTAVPDETEVIVNGHLKTRELIERAVYRPRTCLIISSVNEFNEFLQIVSGKQGVHYGIRIKARPGARIGLSLEELKSLTGIIRELGRAPTLHFHAGWNSTGQKDLEEPLAHLLSAHEILGNAGVAVNCWNFGGSFSEGASYPKQLHDRFQLYKKVLPAEVTAIQFEPGRYLVGDCGELHAQVCDLRDSVPVLNTSTYAFMLTGASPSLCLRKKDGARVPLELREDGNLLSGVWPSENDAIRITPATLQVGDQVIFQNMGAYLDPLRRSLSAEDLLEFRYESRLGPLLDIATEEERNLLFRFWDFQESRLKSYPKRLTDLKILLGLLVRQLTPKTLYMEQDINSFISSYTEDFCTARRDLVELGFLHRQTGSRVIYERRTP